MIPEWNNFYIYFDLIKNMTKFFGISFDIVKVLKVEFLTLYRSGSRFNLPGYSEHNRQSTMASYVLRVISLTLGVFFIFIGTLKLTPSVNKELHKEMVRTDSVLFVSCTNVLLKLNCNI